MPTATTDSGPNDDDTDASEDTGGDPKLDVSAPPPVDEPPPEEFEPTLEWSFSMGVGSQTIPLVANLTDDDGDGDVDLCDTPDVVLIDTEGTAWILDGDTGEPSASFDGIFGLSAAAIADLDSDGVPEIIGASADGNRLRAWRPDGNLVWESEPALGDEWGVNAFWRYGAVAVHDMDGDGTPEIVFNHMVFDNQGGILFAEPDGVFTALQAAIAIDLDGNGTLELVTSHTAWSFDAGFEAPQLLWDLAAAGVPNSEYGLPHPADFDGDGEPEILFTSTEGFLLVAADGSLPWGATPLKPPLATLDCPVGVIYNWQRPGVLHDFDGDDRPELGVSTCNTFAIWDISAAGPQVQWEAVVQDGSGSSGATAFDFLGDGSPEPIYADEVAARAWSGEGGSWSIALELERYSSTWMEYPVVADVDNDGSAEFLVVSMSDAPTLQVFGEAEDRWIGARRIYNQHAYHAVHVREDATIPAHPTPHYLGDNTFRVNTAMDNPPDACNPAG